MLKISIQCFEIPFSVGREEEDDGRFQKRLLKGRGAFVVPIRVDKELDEPAIIIVRTTNCDFNLKRVN